MFLLCWNLLLPCWWSRRIFSILLLQHLIYTQHRPTQKERVQSRGLDFSVSEERQNNPNMLILSLFCWCCWIQFFLLVHREDLQFYMNVWRKQHLFNTLSFLANHLFTALRATHLPEWYASICNYQLWSCWQFSS